MPASVSSSAVTFTASPADSIPPGVDVNGDGTGIVTTGTLAVGSYTLGGSDSDTSGDSGTWSYTLTVTEDAISQTAPLTNDVSVADSATFADSLAASPGFADVVAYSTSGASSPPGLSVSDNGAISTDGTTLAANTYTISGTDSDEYGDTGSWSYSLDVTPTVIVPGLPTSGSTTTANSPNFSSTLTAASGFVGPVTFATSTSGFTIVNGDQLESLGPLTVGGSPYSITGTDSDQYGDTGSWNYTLTVLPSGSKSTIVQTSSTASSVVNTTSSSFTAGPITVEDNTGPVTFLTTKSSTALDVSSSGLISTSGPLPVGTFTVSGTDSDAFGDTGTWTYTLTVTGVSVTVTFNSNGGTGTMAPESESEPTALSLNHFSWTKHTFVDWNTSADGSGVGYSNGAVFPFTSPATLYAQWRAGKVPSHTVVFAANGGAGTMAPETHNTRTAISPNQFTRKGYSL